MITIDLGQFEYYNSVNNEFIYEQGGVVRFEYSLKVLYDWEGVWKKPFLKDRNNLTNEEVMDFYLRMALDPIDEKFMTKEVLETLADYVRDPQTATVFSDNVNGQNGNKASSKTYTSEELYAMMISSNVPLDFENRNLNRLITILRIVSNNNSPPKKMSKNDIYKQNATLNAERKAKLKSKG